MLTALIASLLRMLDPLTGTCPTTCTFPNWTAFRLVHTNGCLNWRHEAAKVWRSRSIHHWPILDIWYIIFMARRGLSRRRLHLSPKMPWSNFGSASMSNAPVASGMTISFIWSGLILIAYDQFLNLWSQPYYVMRMSWWSFKASALQSAYSLLWFTSLRLLLFYRK